MNRDFESGLDSPHKGQHVRLKPLLDHLLAETTWIRLLATAAEERGVVETELEGALVADLPFRGSRHSRAMLTVASLLRLLLLLSWSSSLSCLSSGAEASIAHLPLDATNIRST